MSNWILQNLTCKHKINAMVVFFKAAMKIVIVHFQFTIITVDFHKRTIRLQARN